LNISCRTSIKSARLIHSHSILPVCRALIRFRSGWNVLWHGQINDRMCLTREFERYGFTLLADTYRHSYSSHY